MLSRLCALLARAGVAPEVAAHLAPDVITPVSGSIDGAELDSATDAKLALLSAIVAATHCQACDTAVAPLLALVSNTPTPLSDYDQGRFWHLKGLMALRLDQSLDSATRALHRSLTCLHGDDSAPTRAYRARVYDTLGQLWQRQGQLSEARCQFEEALRHWDVADEAGTALVLGRLGRLCMELGDFASAAEYLGRTLNIVTRRTPEHTAARAQLLAHLGACALGRGGLTAARNYFQQSKRLAQAEDNAYGLAMAALGLGQRAVRCGKMATAQRQLQEAQRQLAAAPFPAEALEEVRGRLNQLLGEIHLAQQRPAEARRALAAARQDWTRATNVSRLDRARLLHSLARAHMQQGEHAHAAPCLREALQHLEATTAEPLRQEIESTLRASLREP